MILYMTQKGSNLNELLILREFIYVVIFIKFILIRHKNPKEIVFQVKKSKKQKIDKIKTKIKINKSVR